VVGSFQAEIISIYKTYGNAESAFLEREQSLTQLKKMDLSAATNAVMMPFMHRRIVCFIFQHNQWRELKLKNCRHPDRWLCCMPSHYVSHLLLVELAGTFDTT
jgi:hypothetical protein